MTNHLVAGTLSISKDRFEAFKNAIQHHEKIEILKTHTDDDGDEYIHFYIEITSVLSLLYIFHAGMNLGSEAMAKALLNK